MAAFLRSRSAGSAETVATYKRRIAAYVAWNGSSAIDRDRFDRYVAAMRERGRSPNGVWLDAEVLTLYAKFVGVPTDGWQRGRPREVPVQWLRDNELESLRQALAASPGGEERVFLLDFLRGTGLRKGEFLGLRWRDVDLETGVVTVRSGKGGKMRTVPLPDDGPPAMARAIEAAREAFWRRYPDKTLEEGRLVQDHVWKDREWWRINNFLRAAAKRAGLKGLDPHPHTFRHSFAVDLTMRRVPQAVVQRLLGHASPATTARYQQIAPADVIEALRNSTPPQ